MLWLRDTPDSRHLRLIHIGLLKICDLLHSQRRHFFISTPNPRPQNSSRTCLFNWNKVQASVQHLWSSSTVMRLPWTTDFGPGSLWMGSVTNCFLIVTTYCYSNSSMWDYAETIHCSVLWIWRSASSMKGRTIHSTMLAEHAAKVADHALKVSEHRTK